MHLISVDFPAPFAPSNAWISPSETERSTFLRTGTPPKDLQMPFTANDIAIAFHIRLLFFPLLFQIFLGQRRAGSHKYQGYVTVAGFVPLLIFISQINHSFAKLAKRKS